MTPQKNNMNLLHSFLKVGDYSTAERAFREFVMTNSETQTCWQCSVLVC